MAASVGRCRLRQYARRGAQLWLALSSWLRATAVAAEPLSPGCPGDCDGSGTTTVEEIVLAVRIALGMSPLGACSAADRDSSGTVTIEEIVQAVVAALNGCSHPTATPVPSMTESPLPSWTPSTRTSSPTATAMPDPNPTGVPPPTQAACFVDVAAEAGLTYVHYEPPWPPPFYEQVFYTAGAAAGDFDGDGREDLAVTQLREPSLLLFRNRGDGSFDEVSAEAGVRMFGARLSGVAWGDVDNDGDLDLYATALGADQRRHYLFINDGSGHFTEEGVPRGAAVATLEPHFGFSVAFGDYDRDGFLDLHVTEWRPRAYNRLGAPSHARLLRNLGAAKPGHFQDVTREAGVALENIPPLRADLGFGFSFTSRFADMDDDGWPDLLIAADFGTSRLFWNNGDGTFVDGTVAAGVGTDENGMGSAVGDIDGDGRLDWFVSSIWDPKARCQGPEGCFWGTSGNRLFRNLGGRKFADVTDEYGVRDAGWAWGAAFWDPDNDGDLDLVVANGIHLPTLDVIGLPELDDDYEQDLLRVWENTGTSMHEVAVRWGIEDRRQGRGVVVWDYDQDGDVDLFVANNSDRPALYRNQCGNRRHWLRVRVVGARTNRDGLHARVRVWPTRSSAPLMREVDGGSNYLGQSERTVHFGLGESGEPVARVEVVWPGSGTVAAWENVGVDRTLEVVEP